MNWIPLQDEKQLEEIVAKSNIIPQVIFKHSTRCAVSSMAKNRLDRKEAPAGVNFYLLDLIRHRNISNKIASDFGVIHQSPQVLESITAHAFLMKATAESSLMRLKPPQPYPNKNVVFCSFTAIKADLIA